MLSKFFKKRHKLFRSNPQPETDKCKREGTCHVLSSNLEENINEFKAVFERCSDIILREIKLGTTEPIRVFLIYVDGLAEKTMISQHVVRALQVHPAIVPQGQRLTRTNAPEIIKDSLLGVTEVEITNKKIEIIDYILMGDLAILIDGSEKAIIASAQGWESRQVEDPATEPVVRGPKDGFTEDLRTNTTLIRRRIKTPDLKMEPVKIGRLTKTDVVFAYIDGIADEKLVQEVRTRLTRIDIDGVLASGYLEEFIEDNPYSVFPQMDATERPDKVAASLLGGYIAIFTDTTPIVLVVPVTFPKFLQSAEDYYNRYIYSSFIRLLRYAALLITLLLPSVYIAIVSFHQEMLPTPLLISIAAQREGTPFPVFVEALFMELAFEVLREAGVRMPRPVGQAVSIVGALVIGEAAVNAGLVSSAMVMVVAFTAIASFTIPTINGSYAARLLRFPIMAMAASLGLFGVMAALMGILIHLCALRSFGIPYLAPLAPFGAGDMKDMFIRAPWWAMINRPGFLRKKNPQRQQMGQQPGTHRQGQIEKPHNQPEKGGGRGAGKR